MDHIKVCSLSNDNFPPVCACKFVWCFVSAKDKSFRYHSDFSFNTVLIFAHKKETKLTLLFPVQKNATVLRWFK